MDPAGAGGAAGGRLRVRCCSCGTKWFYEPHHLAREDIDPTRCGRCGGINEPLVDEPADDARRPA